VIDCQDGYAIFVLILEDWQTNKLQIAAHYMPEKFGSESAKGL